MLDSKEIQKRVSENFKTILEKHAMNNLPVVAKLNNKIVHVYKSGEVVDITSKYKSSNKKESQVYSR